MYATSTKWRVKARDCLNWCRKSIWPFHRKNTPQIGTGDCFDVLEATYEQPTAHLTLSGEGLKVFPLQSGTRQEHLNVKIKIKINHSNRKNEVKLSLFADDMILDIKNPKDSIKKAVRSDKWLQQSRKTQSQHTENNCVFEQYKMTKNNSIYSSSKKNKIRRN